MTTSYGKENYVPIYATSTAHCNVNFSRMLVHSFGASFVQAFSLSISNRNDVSIETPLPPKKR